MGIKWARCAVEMRGVAFFSLLLTHLEDLREGALTNISGDSVAAWQ